MAGSTGGQAPLRVALQHQLLATREVGGRQLRRHGRRIGQLKACEMHGDLAQIVVRHEFDQPVHGRIAAAPLLEILELAVKIARRLARNARKVAAGCGPSLGTMAGRAGQHPGRHGAHIGQRRTDHGGGQVRHRHARCRLG